MAKSQRIGILVEGGKEILVLTVFLRYSYFIDIPFEFY